MGLYLEESGTSPQENILPLECCDIIYNSNRTKYILNFLINCGHQELVYKERLCLNKKAGSWAVTMPRQLVL